MKAILICPAERPSVAMLHEEMPLVLVPMLGKSLVDYWLEYLSSRNCTDVVMLASDRPEQVREYVSNGERWGIKVEVWPATGEEGAIEAALGAFNGDDVDWVELMDRLPLMYADPLFSNYSSWHKVLTALMAQMTGGTRGVREIAPGVWAGLHVEVAPSSRFIPPCWIGQDVRIGEGAVVGPLAIIESRVCVEKGAEIENSVILSDTRVGAQTGIRDSIVCANILIHLPDGGSVRVTDSFLLSTLTEQVRRKATASLVGRMVAAILMVAIMPFASMAMTGSVLRGQAHVQVKTAVKPCLAPSEGVGKTFTYFEVASRYGWIRRWPQLWEAVCGRFALVGNRPVSPDQVEDLKDDFEKLWLSVPAGVISLADCQDRITPFGEAARVHACYYAVRADQKMDCSIFYRVVIVRPLNGILAALRSFASMPARSYELRREN